MNIIEQTASFVLDKCFGPLGQLPRIEATVEHDPDDLFPMHIRPAECAPIGFEPIIDALSLHTQRLVHAYFGITIPDIRCRIVTNPNTDSIECAPFGTLSQAISGAWKRKKLYEIRVMSAQFEQLNRLAADIPPASTIIDL